MADSSRRDEYIEDMMQKLRKDYPGDRLTLLAENGGVPNVCERYRTEYQKRDDYDPAAFEEAVEQMVERMNRDLEQGLAIT